MGEPRASAAGQTTLFHFAMFYPKPWAYSWQRRVVHKAVIVEVLESSDNSNTCLQESNDSFEAGRWLSLTIETTVRTS
jgi:hypothetical protein